MTERQDRGGDEDGERELWLGELLDAAADEYQPDAERLRALVTARIARQGRDGEEGAATGGARRRALRPLGRLGLAGIPAGVALATIGAAAAIAVGATATIAVTSSQDNHAVTIAAPSTSAGTGGSGGSSSHSAAPSESASPAATVQDTHSATPSAAATTPTPTSPALVSAAQSIGQATNPNWSELDLAVTIKQPLTALHVMVKVSKCAGLAGTGSWTTGASGEFTEVTTTDSAGAITYEFELAKGAQATTGTLTFAVQFNHAPGAWKPQDDTYYVAARTATSATASTASGTY